MTSQAGTLLTVAPPADLAQYDQATAAALLTLSSQGTRRVYAHVWQAWRAFATLQGHDPLAMDMSMVSAFLSSQDVTRSTRQRQLSALRTLAKVVYLARPNDQTRTAWEMVKLLKVVNGDGQPGGKERQKRALTPAEADRVLRQWNESTAQHKRNRALVAVLLLTGVRRSEAAALRWSDVDAENGVLTVRHGKRDKRREVPIAGDAALDALKAWRAVQPERCEFIFTGLSAGRHPLHIPTPLTASQVYRVWVATAKRAGIPASAPHDARRTLITEALATGVPLATVQAIAGHEFGQTTLKYAQAVDAREARKLLKLRYG